MNGGEVGLESRRKKYVIGFTVHYGKDLARDGAAIDPLVVVRAFGREYKTQLKQNKLQHVKWEETFIWSDVWVTDAEFNMSFIEFELQSACVFFRNEVVGIGKIQLAMVRKRPNRTYSHKTLRLSNGAQLTAKLKVTVFCYGEGDDPPKPEDEMDDGEDAAAHLEDLGAAVMGAGNADKDTFTQAYHLFVQVHRAEHLGGGEGTFNPYVQCEFNGHSMQLPVARNTNTVTFDECFRIPVVTPLFADSIVIRVWDEKDWAADEVVLQGRLSFSLLRMHALMPKWFNFYGFSKAEVGDVGAITGAGEAAEANAYMGRLLISGRVQKVSSAQGRCIVKGQVMEEPPSTSTTFIADVFEVSGCLGARAFVSVAVGVKMAKTKTVKRDSEKASRFSFKDGRGRIDALTCLVPTDPSNMLDVLVSVWAEQPGGNKSFQRVGFKRINIADVPEWEGDSGFPTWVTLRPMAHLSSSIEPGAVLMTIHRSASQIIDRGIANVKPLNFELRVYCCMARNLKSQRREHLPNAHCQISCGGGVAQTATIRSTTAPVWHQCLQLYIQLQCTLSNLKVHPEPIQVVVYDEDDPDAEVRAESGAAAMAQNALEEMQSLMAADGAKKLGAKAVAGVKDVIGDFRGDVMAKKRLGAVVDGRRVIGRTQINLRRLTRPDGRGMNPKWIKLKGGMMGSHHAGDILIGFELLKRKYSTAVPVKRTKPPARMCTLSVSVLGLRNVQLDEGESLGKPKLQVLGPLVLGNPAAEVVEWSKKPATPITGEDVNRAWSKKGVSGWEFLQVVHLKVAMPKSATFEPDLRFRLYAEGQNVSTDDPAAEGRISLAENLPWVKKEKARQAIQAADEYEDSEGGDARDGVQVSDAEDTDIVKVDYIEVEVGKEQVKVAFNASDAKSFPPVVSELADNSAAKKAGVITGDWLVGYQLPSDTIMKLTGMWTQADAADFVARVDAERIRPLRLRFRRKDKVEITTWLSKHEADHGLVLIQGEDAAPPQILETTAECKAWSANGVKPGWFVVDINGVDLHDISGSSPKLRKLLQMRPVCITCRPYGRAGQGDEERAAEKAEERNFQEDRRVMLSGVPAKLQKEIEHKMKHQDGVLACSRVPRPSAVLPPVTELKHLNMRCARAALLDVQGLTRQIVSVGGGTDDDGDEKSRPSVSGRLEDIIEGNTFCSVKLEKGGQHVGVVKMSYRVIFPANMNWVSEIEDNNSLDYMLFEERALRQRYKIEQPPMIRIRSYIIRGLNVSGGAHTGFGNPYLFFQYGSDLVKLEGHRQLATVEPRFFRTEERDVHLPEEAIFEVGLYDWQDTGAKHELIGKTCIDLEERWYSHAYQSLMKANKVPIEYRPLLNAETNLSRGSLEMWVEILNASQAAEIPASPLVQPPPVEVEIRVICWGARNVSRKLCIDELGDERERVDLMVRCSIESRHFAGEEPKEQQTDVHGGSDGEGEYNWRFVFSRVQVTKGVSLDCFMHLSLWEHFALKRPMLLCESMLDMKHYCKKVAFSREMLEIEAEVPLTSQQLADQLERDGEGLPGDEVDAEQADELDEDADGGDVGPEINAGNKKKEELPPGALMKVTLQVLPQSQASAAENKVGRGRDEPNLNPILFTPKTGRNWQDTFTGAAAAVESIIEGWEGGKRRTRCMMVVLAVVLVVVALHYFKASNGCPIIQSSCRSMDTCPACYQCHHLDRPDAAFCYYGFLSSAEGTCAGSLKDICNTLACACPEGGCSPVQPVRACAGERRSAAPVAPTTR